MSENTMLGFENNITANAYLRYSTDKEYHEAARQFYKSLEFLDVSGYDTELLTIKQIHRMMFNSLLKVYFEKKVNRLLTIAQEKDEFFPALIDYSLASINWREIAETIMENIETP